MSESRGAAVRICSAAGIVLLAIPLVPIQPLFPNVLDIAANMTPFQWLLGAAAVGAASWCFSLLYSGPLPAPWHWFQDGMSRRAAGLVLGIVLTEMCLISCLVFEHRPHLIDSIVQLFQAKIFAEGQLWAPAPKNSAFFFTQHMLFDSGRWYSQYPPGHSLLLSLGVRIGFAWTVPIVLAMFSAVFIYTFACKIYDRQTGALTLLLFPFCSFFLFMGASFMNHVSMIFCVSLFCTAYASWAEKGRRGSLVIAGAALGFGCLIRPLTAIAVGIVFGVLGALQILRDKRVVEPIAAALVCAAVAGLYLIHNISTTGSALLPGYFKLWGAQHGLGFHESPWGALHTPLTGLRNELIDLYVLNEFLMEWPYPSVWIVASFFAFGLAKRRWDRRLLAAFFVLPAAYLFYWHRDQFLGPRFLFCSLVFLLPLFARAVLEIGRAAERYQTPAVPGIRSTALSRVFACVLIISFGCGIAYGMPNRARIYYSSSPRMKLDLRAEAEKQGVKQGLVFVSVSWGSRLRANLREAGLSASRTEKVYRRADHCRLQLLLDRFLSGNFSESEMNTEVQELMDRFSNARQVGLNGDPTLLLTPRLHLPDRCINQIGYDRQSEYVKYAPHLADNHPLLNGSFVFARDLRDRNWELMQQYPELQPYLYRKGRFEKLRRYMELSGNTW